jgi:hypothetical protein
MRPRPQTYWSCSPPCTAGTTAGHSPPCKSGQGGAHGSLRGWCGLAKPRSAQPVIECLVLQGRACPLSLPRLAPFRQPRPLARAACYHPSRLQVAAVVSRRHFPCRRGVVAVLRVLLDDSAAPLAPETRQALKAGRLPVPTSRSLLAPAGQCLYASSAPSRAILARCVHVWVGLQSLLEAPVCCSAAAPCGGARVLLLVVRGAAPFGIRWALD